MGHLFYDEKPNYKREIVKEYLHKNKMVFGEYDDISLKEFVHFVSELQKIEKKGKRIIIDVDVMETSEGFCQGSDEVRLVPYFEREENDKEYKERIEDEERQYRENLERERLKKEEYEEYVKDMAEVERIKQKYHIR